MALIVGVALALLSLAVVVYPFAIARRNSRQSRQGDGQPDNQYDSQAAQANLEEIYAAIETLRLEHQLGNIPQGLYQEQMKGYRLDAARVLRRQVQMSRTENSDPDFLLEQEILAARSSIQDPDEPGAGNPGGHPHG